MNCIQHFYPTPSSSPPLPPPKPTAHRPPPTTTPQTTQVLQKQYSDTIDKERERMVSEKLALEEKYDKLFDSYQAPTERRSPRPALASAVHTPSSRRASQVVMKDAGEWKSRAAAAEAAKEQMEKMVANAKESVTQHLFEPKPPII